MLWIACSLALFASEPAAVSTSHELAPIDGDSRQATSVNFSVRSFHASHDARQVAEHCERWRTKLQRYWCADELDAWQPRCEVVIHADIGSYLNVVGAGGRQTLGSSLLTFSAGGQVARRTIDFRGDHEQGIAALPHEMTHIIVGDLLGGHQPPRWADEGMAILADPREKQLLHERDLSHGLANRAAFRLSELVQLNDYPHPSRLATFYGQSASLTACLANRDDPARFIEFLRRALDQGYDRALSDVYQIDDVAALERMWNEQRLARRSGFHGVRLAIDDVPRPSLLEMGPFAPEE